MNLYVVISIALGFFIWLSDLSWWQYAEDTLPILAAFPLFYYFGEPWKFEEDKPLKTAWVYAAILFFLVGVIFNLKLLLAFSWVFFFKAIPITQPSVSDLNKLLAIPLFGFPWVSFDANGIGWFFRLSGANVVASLFSGFGFDVVQEGTHLIVNQVPISVEAACSGLNTLQSMMIAGLALAYLYLKDSTLYWLNVPLLLILAWIANTLRILLISLTAIYISPQFALGAFHLWGGAIVILIMFLIAYLVIRWEEKWI